MNKLYNFDYKDSNGKVNAIWGLGLAGSSGYIQDPDLRAWPNVSMKDIYRLDKSSAYQKPALVYDARIDELMNEMAELKARIEDISRSISNQPEIIDLRDVPYADAKDEIRAFFKAHHGETYDESDLMMALKIDPDLIRAVCKELSEEGEIKPV